MTQTKQFVLPMRASTARGLSLFVLACACAGYLGEIVWADAPPGTDMVFSALKIAGLVGAIALFLSIWGQQSMAGDALIDERQQRERDRAFTLAHSYMVFAAILSFFYIEFSQKLGLPVPRDRSEAAGLLSVYVLLSLALPGIILAWQAPSDQEEDA